MDRHLVLGPLVPQQCTPQDDSTPTWDATGP